MDLELNLIFPQVHVRTLSACKEMGAVSGHSEQKIESKNVNLTIKAEFFNFGSQEWQKR